jgi:hypothetical protein
MAEIDPTTTAKKAAYVENSSDERRWVNMDYRRPGSRKYTVSVQAR